MSGFCKVEMSKLSFRQMAEAEIGICDDERKRVAAYGRVADYTTTTGKAKHVPAVCAGLEHTSFPGQMRVSSKSLARRTLRVPVIRHFLMRRTFP